MDTHGATIRAQAASLEQEHQAIVRDVLAAGDFWGGAGSVACQEFITQLGRNFQVIYEQANSHGQKVQSAGSNMASTDSAVGSSWAVAHLHNEGAAHRKVCGPFSFSLLVRSPGADTRDLGGRWSFRCTRAGRRRAGTLARLSPARRRRVATDQVAVGADSNGQPLTSLATAGVRATRTAPTATVHH